MKRIKTILVKISILREQANQNKEMKITDFVLLSLFVKNNGKCNTSLAPLVMLSISFLNKN